MTKIVTQSRTTGQPIPRATRLCRVLSSDVRRRILLALAEEPATVTDLAKRIDVAPMCASSNLAPLYDHDLVRVTPAGTKRIYELSNLVSVLKTSKCATVAVRSPDGSEVTITAPYVKSQ